MIVLPRRLRRSAPAGALTDPVRPTRSTRPFRTSTAPSAIGDASTPVTICAPSSRSVRGSAPAVIATHIATTAALAVCLIRARIGALEYTVPDAHRPGAHDFHRHRR